MGFELFKLMTLCPIQAKRFMRSQDGVVTVEWVAIAAAVAVGAVAISFIVMRSLVSPANHIASQLSPG